MHTHTRVARGLRAVAVQGGRQRLWKCRIITVCVWRPRAAHPAVLCCHGRRSLDARAFSRRTCQRARPLVARSVGRHTPSTAPSSVRRLRSRGPRQSYAVIIRHFLCALRGYSGSGVPQAGAGSGVPQAVVFSCILLSFFLLLVFIAMAYARVAYLHCSFAITSLPWKPPLSCTASASARRSKGKVSAMTGSIPRSATNLKSSSMTSCVG